MPPVRKTNAIVITLYPCAQDDPERDHSIYEYERIAWNDLKVNHQKNTTYRVALPSSKGEYKAYNYYRSVMRAFDHVKDFLEKKVKEGGGDSLFKITENDNFQLDLTNKRNATVFCSGINLLFNEQERFRFKDNSITDSQEQTNAALLECVNSIFTNIAYVDVPQHVILSSVSRHRHADASANHPYARKAPKPNQRLPHDDMTTQESAPSLQFTSDGVLDEKAVRLTVDEVRLATRCFPDFSPKTP